MKEATILSQEALNAVFPADLHQLITETLDINKSEAETLEELLEAETKIIAKWNIK